MSDCEQCHGRGWMVERDGGAGTAKPCACRATEPLEPKLKRAGVREDLIGASFATWNPAINGDIPAQVLAYAANPAGSLTLIGQPGRGKSHLAASVTRVMVERGVYARWCNVRLFLRELKRSQNFEWRDDQVALLQGAAFTALDDLGTERTDFDLDTIASIIDSRYVDRLPAVYTSNMSMPEIQDREPRIASRLAGGVVVELEGRDYRIASKKPALVSSLRPRGEVRR